MNVALPILLLVFGGLTLWLLTESTIRWYFKASCIVAFCTFTVIFWTTIYTFLGWPAHEDDVPEIVLIHWVIIKEPDKLSGSEGSIYFLLESAGGKKKSFFGYSSSGSEPRLFGLPYSRELHEQIAKQMMGKLRRGQPVMGKLKKGEGGIGTKGKRKGGEGGGSESQGQNWEFHELLPSEMHRKSEN